MEKKEKHAKMEQFRKEIVSPNGRKRKLEELTSELKNGSVNELDVLKAIVFLQKKSLVPGCEDEYRLLIAAAIRSGDAKLVKLAKAFAKNVPD